MCWSCTSELSDAAVLGMLDFWWQLLMYAEEKF